MKSFTINDLERFSGVKAHTLRVWERRYSLLQPHRTAGNFRFYTLDELKKILNIALLNRNGFRISGLSKIRSNVIEDKVGSLSQDDNKWQKAINELTISMYTLEPESFEWVLDKLLLSWPIDILVEKILYPFLNITGLLCTGNKLSEEHIVVTAIRKKLILAIETVSYSAMADKTVLLFLPDSKQLDLGLLYSNFYLKRRGIHVLYLGTDVTVQNLQSIIHVHPPTYLFTYLKQNHHFPTAQLLECMNVYAPSAKFIIGDYLMEPALPIFSGNLIHMKYANALEFLHEELK